MTITYKFYKNILWRIDKVFAEPADILDVKTIQCDKTDFLNLGKPLVIRWIEEQNNKKKHLWFIVQEDIIELDDLSANTRSKVRRGLKRFEFKQLGRDSLIEQGYILYRKLFRSRPGKPMSREQFKTHIERLPSHFVFWGVFEKAKNQLVGYIQIFEGSKNVYLRVINILNEANRHYASYAMFFWLNKIYVKELNKRIVLGLRTLTSRSNVQKFVIDKFFYRRLYVDFGLCLSFRAKYIYLILRPFKNFIRNLPFRLSVFISAFLEFIYLAKNRK